LNIKSKYDLGEVVFYPSSDRMRAVVVRDVITAVVYTEEGLKYLTSYTQYGLPEKELSRTYKAAVKKLDIGLIEKRDQMIEDINGVVEKIRVAKKNELLYDAAPKNEENK